MSSYGRYTGNQSDYQHDYHNARYYKTGDSETLCFGFALCGTDDTENRSERRKDKAHDYSGDLNIGNENRGAAKH